MKDLINFSKTGFGQISFLFFLNNFSSNAYGDLGSCRRHMDLALHQPASKSPLTKDEDLRLASEVRSSADNIIQGRTLGETNIGWKNRYAVFTSSYQTEDGRKIDLIFSQVGILDSYLITKNNKQILVKCIGETEAQKGANEK